MKYLSIFILLNMLACIASFGQDSSFVFLFDEGKARVAPFEARAFMKKFNPKTKYLITIHGHTDSIGSDEYNQNLSAARVAVIKEFLIVNGFKKKQIIVEQALGETQHIADNNSPESRLQNRRVNVTMSIVPEPIPEPKPIPKPKPAPKPKPIKAPVIKKDKVIKAGKQLSVKNVKKGAKLAMPNLLFMGSSHRLVNENNPIIDTLINIMNAKPSMKIKLVGHTCCLNPGEIDAYDFETGRTDLSVARAEEIYNKLIAAGIEASRMSFEGKGSSERLYPREKTQFEMDNNKRVEIIVTAE